MSLNLYEGHVSRVETIKDGKWTLIHTRENRKPLAFNANALSVLPLRGDKINVQAKQGQAWYFGEHRSMVIVRDEPFFPVEGLPNNVQERTSMVCSLILKYLDVNPQVSSDDVYDEAVRRVGKDVDPRFIGHGFRVLSKTKRIHKIGTKKSERVESNHARDVSVWTLTKK